MRLSIIMISVITFRLISNLMISAEIKSPLIVSNDVFIRGLVDVSFSRVVSYANPNLITLRC